MAFNNSPKKADKKATEKYNGRNMNTNSSEAIPVFLVNVAYVNMLETAAGIHAEASCVSPEVKSFGKMMINHHSQMLNALREFTSAKGVVLPSVISDKGKKKVNSLSGEHETNLMKSVRKPWWMIIKK